MPQIGLVSHPELEIHTDVVDVCIALRCSTVAALQAKLYLTRVSGTEEVERATLVYKFEDQFLVQVKVPMSSSKYELSFMISTKHFPHILKEHPLKYQIHTSDVCQNLLASLKHSLALKFGFSVMPPTAQLHGICIVAPKTYRVNPEEVYFLVHVAGEEAARNAEDAKAAPSLTSKLFTDRLRRSEALPSSTPRQRRASKILSSDGTIVNWAADFHEPLSESVESYCQDSQGSLHFDLCISDKYVIRLQQRVDIPELFESLVSFEKADVGNHVALFLRRPKANSAEYFPQKIAEWMVCLEENFPLHF